MSTATKTVLQRMGLGLAMIGLAAGALAATSDDAGSPAAADTSAPVAQNDQADQPGAPARYGLGHPGAHRGYGHGRDGQDRGRMMGHRRFHGRMGEHGRSAALMMDLRLLGAIHHLNLTPAQHDQVRTVIFDAMQAAQHQRFEAGMKARQAARDNAAVLSNPGDPNYGRAVQQLKSRAVDRVQQSIQLATDTEQKLYGVLTAEQKAQLPKVLSDMAARRQARMSMRMRPHRGPLGEAPPSPPAQ